jgi:hypothetical protein
MNRNKKTKNVKVNKNIEQIQSINSITSTNNPSQNRGNTKYHPQG